MYNMKNLDKIKALKDKTKKGKILADIDKKKSKTILK